MTNLLDLKRKENLDLNGKSIPLNKLCNEIWPDNIDLAIEMTEHDLLVGKHHINSKDMN